MRRGGISIRNMCLNSYFICFVIFLWSSLYANPCLIGAVPTKQWSVQAYGFATRYHTAIDYAPGAGFGLALGRQFFSSWLALGAGMEYTRARQTLIVVRGVQQSKVDLYQIFLTGRGSWRPGKQSRLLLMAEAQAGILLLQPQPLTLDAGTSGSVRLHPKREVKLAPAMVGGMIFRVIREMAVLLFLKQSFSRFEERQIGLDKTTKRWRPYWLYGAGLSFHF
jgi:hypothetical protein